ncbi:MAG TPA: 50S ribosomal protein L6 [Acidimicrobiaceae bacterium]|jgi:large subunit ribosomal protein L6|nr:50S ribosomal protein L6 [Acidimicrobiaceae bacterium]MCH2633102.1 50S ribosomal protein L6 [Acidimicrobiales bacterium]MAP98447.1 50S ribosomal protein L6 [Acidimicrobiaceae bacterium]HAA65496.1 50S ribosomal protein L6 [Acidimicrobiaceae bacterium]HAY64780.1 50S ribosomal protein L6 [Acidimicrobiaceae bacterium]|tara:strand:- start:1505 stop:2044 length:540 start_codon:yes stop_codon:yes gene_type:complete
MSRVGKAPITIPDGLSVEISDDMIKVSGKQGELTQQIPEGIDIQVEDSVITVERADDSRQQRSLHGLARALVNNMVEGVSNGFMKELNIVGVGYRAQAKGTNALELALGFSHPVQVEAPEGVTFDVPEPTIIKVSGIDKQLVGQVAADIRALKKPEPYKGKGIRYVDEYVIRKAGKAAK